jgi:hypothetical protein
MRSASAPTAPWSASSGARYYNFEWRDAEQQWWHLHFRHAASHDEAMRDVDFLAKYTGMKWRDVCQHMRPTHYPLS